MPRFHMDWLFLCLLLFSNISENPALAQASNTTMNAAESVKLLGWCERLLTEYFPNKKALAISSNGLDPEPTIQVARLSEGGFNWLFAAHDNPGIKRLHPSEQARQYIGQIAFSPQLGNKYFIPAFTKSGAALFFRTKSAEEAAKIFDELKLKRKSGYAVREHLAGHQGDEISVPLRNSLPSADGPLLLEIGIDYGPHSSMPLEGPMGQSKGLSYAEAPSSRRKVLAKTLMLLNSFHPMRFVDHGELLRQRNFGLNLSERDRTIAAIGFERITSVDVYKEAVDKFRTIQLARPPSAASESPSWFGLAAFSGRTRYVFFEEAFGIFEISIRAHSIADSLALSHEFNELSRELGLMLDIETRASLNAGHRQLPENDGHLYFSARIIYGRNKIADSKDRHVLANFLRSLAQRHHLEFVHDSIVRNPTAASQRRETKQNELGLPQPEPDSVRMLKTPFYGIREQYEHQGVFSDFTWQRYDEKNHNGWVGKLILGHYSLEVIFSDSNDVAVVISIKGERTQVFPEWLLKRAIDAGDKTEERGFESSLRFQAISGRILATDFQKLNMGRNHALRPFVESLTHILEAAIEQTDHPLARAQNIEQQFPASIFPALAHPRLKGIVWLVAQSEGSSSVSLIARGLWHTRLGKASGDYQIDLHHNGMLDLQIRYPSEEKVPRIDLVSLRQKLESEALVFLGHSTVVVEASGHSVPEGKVQGAAITIKDVPMASLRSAELLLHLKNMLDLSGW